MNMLIKNNKLQDLYIKEIEKRSYKIYVGKSL